MARRGFSLLELVVAGALLAVVMTVCLQMFGSTAAQRRAAQNRQTAIQEAANLMERLAATPWDELTAENVRDAKLSDGIAQGLPGGELAVQIADPPEDPGAKRITVSIRWQGDSGEFLPPVRLVAWRYRNIQTTDGT